MSEFSTDSRVQAHAFGRAGFVFFSRAFNATNEPDIEWRYSDEVKERFEELCAELLSLIEEGDIEVNPGHAHYVAARDARNDPALRELIRKASRKTPIKAKKA